MNTYTSSETTKMKMINAAGELAAEFGFSNISTRAIAQRAGENIGSIHYHFDGKDGLLKEMVRRALQDCIESRLSIQIEFSTACLTPEELSKRLRTLVRRLISMMFDPNKPRWHAQVIYQLSQRDDQWYELLNQEMISPDHDIVRRFFLEINPDLSDEDLFLHSSLLTLPVFSHATYIPVILKVLKTDHLSEAYLEKLEDLLVRQTQLLMGLPLDKQQPVLRGDSHGSEN